MLTDDELSRELGAAFRTATAELTYTGRRRPARRTAVVALPVVAAVAAVGVAVIPAVHTNGPEEAPSTQAPPSAGAAPPAAMVSDSIDLAGVTLHYQRPAGAPDPIRFDDDVDRVPDGATAVPLTVPGEAWVGVDPVSGDNAIYVRAPKRNGGQLFAVLSSTWTRDQLVDLLLDGSPN